MSATYRKFVMENYKPGLYQLARDVENPHPDRRKVRNWTAQTEWKKGERFIFRHRFVDRREDGTILYCGELGKVGTYDSLNDMSDGFKALLDALVPVEHTVSSYLVMQDWSHPSNKILQKLVDTKKLSLDDIGEAIKLIHEDWDREEKEREALQKK
jgi:hypothetical protein